MLSLSIIVIAVSIISSNGGGYESSSFIVFSQKKDTNQKMLLHSLSTANSNTSINANCITTFSSIWIINSLVITFPENEFDITNTFKVILTGDCEIHKSSKLLIDIKLWFFLDYSTLGKLVTFLQLYRLE